jgi:HSP20 family protein
LENYARPARKSLAKGSHQSFVVGIWVPTVDIDDSEEAFVMKAELPGVQNYDGSVHIENNVLTNKGEKKTGIENNKRLRVGGHYGCFIWSFTPPQSVKIDVEAVEAEFKNGALKLTIPKVEKARPLQIDVDIK